TLDAGEHDDRRRGRGQGHAAGLAAEDLDEFLVDDLDHLLRRVERLGDLDAGRTLLDAFDESAHDGQGDIRLQQREADFAGGGVDVRLGQFALAAEPGEGTGQAV